MHYVNMKRAKHSTNSGMPVWNIYREIADQQNTLIAGETGSGKSTVLKGVIYSICADYAPTEAELWLADPKRVDLIKWYDRKLPHLRRYSNTLPEIKQMIQDLIGVMEIRYAWMEEHRIDCFTGRRIYLIVDELCDLVMSDKGIVPILAKLLMLGRAAGIRCILCTQSPSRLTIAAQLQVNFTAALALQCKSAIESRQILNQPGAELLPRYGKGLLTTPEHAPVMVDLPLQDDREIDEMVQRSIAYTTY